MIKLIVSDFDGTLLPYGRERISVEVVNYIKNILDKGTVFAISSGRTYSELCELLCEFKDKIYFICSDGAYYIKNGRTLYERSIAPSDLALFDGKNGASYYR